MNSQLLSLLQLGDSNFPSGAFSHSFGLETYIQDESVHNKETFFEWIRIYLEKQLAYTDGLACLLTIDALEKKAIDEIWNLDRKLFVQNLPLETRQANRRIGERLIVIGIDLYSIPLLVDYLKKIRRNEAFGHPAIAFMIICDFLKIDRNQAILTFLYSTITTLVQNGVRGIPLGQTAGQRILLEIHPVLLGTVKRIEALDIDDFGAVAPGIEIAQMRHEKLHVRLFMS
ncbi:urease accessory protein UreF [Neobacillus sp. CF12]|uniref:urease accessory protein UreF n=1 Tax=Neobacillus sp. CF12 TaxID=3055864 RepID=UPI0025A3040B|nr:urease accessory protein UreF [Neobacillus sp. CF12]MDM5328823.1 urease accessory protein UreF [Neobacillus sp. CF12]